MSAIFLSRISNTMEATISKIFPAGFGWQTSSILAVNNSLDPDTLGFALSTGTGDAMGVFLGHLAYYRLKKSAGYNIDMRETIQTGTLLSTAAFCSGTVWQPIVNTLQGMDQSFVTVFGGTWIGCASAFYIGLRTSRNILPKIGFDKIEYPSAINNSNDLQLSTSIGGATAFFVGTDTSYLPSENFLMFTVGIFPNTAHLTSCVIAGTSTSLGFFMTQNLLNATTRKSWTD
jgi:hypothetical protein